MATVHLFESRRWLGWYNSPGAYEVAKQYGQLANSRLWDGLFPGTNCEPAELFGLDGQSGPAFLAARSGSSIPYTGHIASLISRKARSMKNACVISGKRHTTPASVTVIDLTYAPEETLNPSLLKNHAYLYALIPITTSIATCVLCALVQDWWCFASIALGMFASGVACLIIGSGVLQFCHPKPAQGAPRGDGILVQEGTDGSVVVLRGQEAAVNSITRGRFSLQYDGEPKYNLIGHCSVLLTVQFLTQLLLIPQGTLFGQLMFILSLAVSWAFTTYLSSLPKEEHQTTILFELLHLDGANLRTFTLGTYTTMVVFSCLALQSNDSIHKPRKILDKLIRNDTDVWERWKDLVSERLSSRKDMTFGPEDWDMEELGDEGKNLLRELLGDAETAYTGWQRELLPLSLSSSHGDSSSSALKAL